MVSLVDGKCSLGSAPHALEAVSKWRVGWGACPNVWPSVGPPPVSPLCLYDPRAKSRRVVTSGLCADNHGIQGQPSLAEPDVQCPDGQELQADTQGRTPDVCCRDKEVKGKCTGNTNEPDVVCGAGLVLRTNPQTKSCGTDPALVQKKCCKKDRRVPADTDPDPDPDTDTNVDADTEEPADIDTVSRFARSDEDWLELDAEDGLEPDEEPPTCEGAALDRIANPED